MISLFKLYTINLVIQVTGWLISVLIYTEALYDVCGSLTFIITLWGPLASSQIHSLNTRQWLLIMMVTCWTLRLGLFLAIRGWRFGDSRLKAILHRSKLQFLGAWWIQSIWVFTTCLPVYVILQQPSSALTELTPFDVVGLGLWLVGFLFETVADTQKFLFKMDSKNGGKFIQSGLWRYCRHPNYFGECMLWIGIGGTCLEGLLGWYKVLAFLPPVVVWILLHYVSGIPMLEKKAEKQHGKKNNYCIYKNSTNLFWPWFPKKNN